MSGRIVASTTLFALAHDVEPRTLEAITGLAIEELTRTDARFDNDIPAKLWRVLCARHPNVALPLRMAEVTPLDYLGPLAHGVRFASSLRQALDTFIRFRGILSDALETRIVKEEGVAALVTRHPSDVLDDGAGAEVGLALGVRFVRAHAPSRGCSRTSRRTFRMPSTRSPGVMSWSKSATPSRRTSRSRSTARKRSRAGSASRCGRYSVRCRDTGRPCVRCWTRRGARRPNGSSRIVASAWMRSPSY